MQLIGSLSLRSSRCMLCGFVVESGGVGGFEKPENGKDKKKELLETLGKQMNSFTLWPISNSASLHKLREQSRVPSVDKTIVW